MSIPIQDIDDSVQSLIDPDLNRIENEPASTPTYNSVSPEVKKKVNLKLAYFASNTVRWSAAYWGIVFGSALLSTLAALVLKLDVLKKSNLLVLDYTDVAAILAAASAVFISISTAGNFAGKWNANRTAKTRSEQLSNEMITHNLSDKEVIDKLNEIIEDQNGGVINFLAKPKKGLRTGRNRK